LAKISTKTTKTKRQNSSDFSRLKGEMGENFAKFALKDCFAYQIHEQRLAVRNSQKDNGIGIGIGTPKHWHYGKDGWHWHSETLVLMARRQLNVKDIEISLT
jgi:hypothetical protein